MQRLLKLFYRAIVPVILISCNSNHLITDDDYRARTDSAFAERKALAFHRSNELFNVLENNLSAEQSEALKFLYAYMPLNDLADYSGEFFLANVDRALAARERVPWGKMIPEDIFLHYVLPYRVNNENLDSFRIAFFDEIHDRIKGMDLEKAALEINYWSHEKVAYQPADIRTSAPMSTILSARGRCGEESTLTVSALRTAGIPARQVYTPRWAHQDDNHAWVEIWMDGKWYYMGACEPEQIFDRGWFTEFARRTMLVHTKSFGAAYGNENIINLHRNFTEVNNLAKYAETKRIFIKVLQKDGKACEGASVEYKLYNYSEFYPLSTVPTDIHGVSSFETGFGDLMIWAHKGNEFAWKIISVNAIDTLELVLDPQAGNSFSLDADLFAPQTPAPFAELSEEIIRRNAERLEKGAQIRKAYTSSWINDDEEKSIAGKLKMDPGRTKLIFQRSMGNYTEIRKFLLNMPDSLLEKAFTLLDVLPDKDLRDTKASILSDHVLNTPDNKSITPEMFRTCVLNPRIDNEMLIAWRSYFRENLPDDLKNKAVSDPGLLKEYLEKYILIRDEENYYGTPLTPVGVQMLKVSDKPSRAICFVAMCRSIGIPARLEPGRNVPQYWAEEKWHDVYFNDQEEYTGPKGYIRMVTEQKNPEPQYYTNFTLARFEDGKYSTLEYEYSRKVSEFEELELPAGSYLLVTGNRPDDKMILASLSFFELSAGEHKIVEVNLRKTEKTGQVFGSVDMRRILAAFPGANIQSVPGKVTVLAWIDQEQEPSRHVFSDLPPYKNELNSWGGNILFLSETAQVAGVKNLPEKAYFGVDKDLKMLIGDVHLQDVSGKKLPFILIVDDEGKIRFVSSGYRIGIGEQILRHVR